MSKITQLHVYIAGAVLLAIVGAGLYFTLLKPVQAQVADLRNQVTTTESTSVQVGGRSFTISQMQAAEAQLAAVRAQKEKRQRELLVLETRKQLPPGQRLDFGNGTQSYILANTMPRWFNLPRVVVETMERFAERQAKRHGVTATTQFGMPAPTTDPSRLPKPGEVFAVPLGNMSVVGPFPRVLAWVKSWNDAPLLVSVDNLKCTLAGANGEVRATATLTVYIFPTGKAPQGMPAAPAGGAPGGYPGGGYPGGMPGGAMPGGNMAGNMPS